MTLPATRKAPSTPQQAAAALSAHLLTKPSLTGLHLLSPTEYRKATAAYNKWAEKRDLLETVAVLAVSPISDHDHNKPSVSKTADYYWENRCD